MNDAIDIFAKAMGVPDNDDNPPVVAGSFSPQHTAITYVDINADGKMRVATAHFAKGGEFADTDDDWKNYVSNVVDQLRRILDTVPLPTETDAANQMGAIRFRFNFRNLTFKSKHHVFVALGSPLEFNIHHPFSFIRDVFLEDGATSRRNDKNKSFVNSRHLDGFIPNLSVAYMQNCYRKARGLSVVDIEVGDALQYTMNINVMIPVITGVGNFIPIAIDPDTGNGMGPNP